MALLRCSICGERPAEIYQPHTGLKLCKQCFFEQIKKRVKQEVSRWQLFKSNHKLLLAVSGGKDSFVLVDVISEVHDTGKLIALTIVEGIPGGYHEEELRNISKELGRRGIDHLVVSFKDFFGISLEEVVERSIRLRLGIRACTYCGVFRRRIMSDVARSLKVDRVLTAHNLDDESQTAIMNILRGDIVGLVKVHPLAALASREFTPRVKPLRKIYEWETTVYADKKGYSLQTMDCPYLSQMPTLRLDIRLELYSLERRFPGILLKFLESLDLALYEKALEESKKQVKLSRCERCGAPTSPGRKICKTCELLEKIGRQNWYEGLEERIASIMNKYIHTARRSL